MDSLDNLLAQLKAEHEASAKPEQRNPKPFTTEPLIQPLPKSASLIDHLLAEFKVQYEEQDRAEELRRQQEWQQVKAQQLEVLKSQAKVWLENLDPLSTEGLWFENFAEKYSSKLEAALDYLQEIKENNC